MHCSEDDVMRSKITMEQPWLMTRSFSNMCPTIKLAAPTDTVTYAKKFKTGGSRIQKRILNTSEDTIADGIGEERRPWRWRRSLRLSLRPSTEHSSFHSSTKNEPIGIEEEMGFLGDACGSRRPNMHTCVRPTPPHSVSGRRRRNAPPSQQTGTMASRHGRPMNETYLTLLLF